MLTDPVAASAAIQRLEEKAAQASADERARIVCWLRAHAWQCAKTSALKEAEVCLKIARQIDRGIHR